MATREEARLARLTELARRVWPNDQGIEVKRAGDYLRVLATVPSMRVLASVSHARPYDALEAALLVMAGETPLVAAGQGAMSRLASSGELGSPRPAKSALEATAIAYEQRARAAEDQLRRIRVQVEDPAVDDEHLRLLVAAILENKQLVLSGEPGSGGLSGPEALRLRIGYERERARAQAAEAKLAKVRALGKSPNYDKSIPKSDLRVILDEEP